MREFCDVSNLKEVYSVADLVESQMSKELRVYGYTSYLQQFFPVKQSALMPIFAEGVEEMTIETRLFQCLRRIAFFCQERSHTSQYTCHSSDVNHQITCPFHS
jgi:hypothetical protein